MDGVMERLNGPRPPDRLPLTPIAAAVLTLITTMRAEALAARILAMK